jgi:hypothetical protein
MKILSYDLDKSIPRLMLEADVPVTVECDSELCQNGFKIECRYEDVYIEEGDDGKKFVVTDGTITDKPCPKCRGTGRRQMVAKVRVEINHGIIDLDTARGYNERIVWNYVGIESHNTLGKLIQDILTRLAQGEEIEGVELHEP